MHTISFDGLDLEQMRALRRQFNEQYSKTLYLREKEENEAIKSFLDNYRGDWDILSLNHYGITREERSRLRKISECISAAFQDLYTLKGEVFRRAKNEGIPFSTLFYITTKRIKKFQAS